jgi:hypothetical protein
MQVFRPLDLLTLPEDEALEHIAEASFWNLYDEWVCHFLN